MRMTHGSSSGVVLWCAVLCCVVMWPLPLQVLQPFETLALNKLEALSLLVLVISLHMALLWRDPFFAARGTPNTVLTVVFVSTQALLLCAFIAVKANFLCKTLVLLKTRRALMARRKTGSRAQRDAPSLQTASDLSTCVMSPSLFCWFFPGRAGGRGAEASIRWSV